MLDKVILQQFQQFVQMFLTDTQKIVLAETLMLKERLETLLPGRGLFKQSIPASIARKNKRIKTLGISA